MKPAFTMTILQRLVLILCIGTVASPAWANELTPEEAAFRELFRELVEINTTLSVGDCTKAAEVVAARLKTAGLPERDIHVIVPPGFPREGNLVATLRGSNPNSKAILLLAHIDVVEAKREDWIRDPFTLVEEDGYFYGRGVVDDKAMAAIFADMFVRMKQEGYQPERTLKMALTCGEESSDAVNGVSYLLKEHRKLIEAEFAINEGGGGRIGPDGRYVFNGIQAGEKLYQDYRLEITNAGGHSSRPQKDNAIYRLAAALSRIEAHNFPIEFNDTTRHFFDRMSTIISGQIAQDLQAILQDPPDPEALKRVTGDPSYNSILHTTCVATMLDAGHAPNALPQRAGANINCRIFPGHTAEDIRQVLERVVADQDMAITFAYPPESSAPPPPLTPEILEPIEQLTEQMWPGVPVLPSMIAGGTDGRFLTPAGIPT
ncbi:MAG: M20/M25/M40 family metallo-hydrolase, partial [Pseudomonadota bacterium]